MNRIIKQYTLDYRDTRLLLLGDVVRVDFPNSVPAYAHKFTLHVQQDGIGGRLFTGFMRPTTFVGDQPDLNATGISVYEFSTADGGANWVCRITTSVSQGVPEGASDGDVPIWDSSIGQYVPGPVSGGGGGEGSITAGRIYAYEFGPGEATVEKPANCVRVRAVLVGGGASGCGGAGVGGTLDGLGGAGGNPGSILYLDLPASAFSDFIGVSVGSGGQSVAGSTSPSPSGANSGASTTVGNFTAYGGSAAVGQVAIDAPNNSCYINGVLYTGGRGGSGGNPSSITPVPTIEIAAPTGGGGGGGRWGTSSSAGSNGGAYVDNPIGLPTQGANSGGPVGGHGANGITNNFLLGMGGGGGGARGSGGVGGNGGNGGYPGGGGGGGGAGTDDRGGNSGAGGDGYAYIELICQD